MNDSLTQFKDIHLPAEVSWWPPAPGWWLLALLVISLLVLVVRYVRRRPPKLSLRREARDAVKAIRLDWQQRKHPQQLVAQLSALIRQVAISRFPQEDIAGKTGEPWLRWMDQQIGGHDFEKGKGRLLLDAAYRPRVDLENGDALITLVEQWIDKVTGGRKHA